jgi:hypothetical protein
MNVSVFDFFRIDVGPSSANTVGLMIAAPRCASTSCYPTTTQRSAHGEVRTVCLHVEQQENRWKARREHSLVRNPSGRPSVWHESRTGSEVTSASRHDRRHRACGRRQVVPPLHMPIESPGGCRGRIPGQLWSGNSVSLLVRLGPDCSVPLKLLVTNGSIGFIERVLIGTAETRDGVNLRFRLQTSAKISAPASLLLRARRSSHRPSLPSAKRICFT